MSWLCIVSPANVYDLIAYLAFFVSACTVQSYLMDITMFLYNILI